MLIPDPGSDFFPSRISDPNCLHPGSRIRIKEFKYFNPKKMVSKIYKIWSGLFIPDPDADFLPISDPGVKKAPDPGSGSATLLVPYRNGTIPSTKKLPVVSVAHLGPHGSVSMGSQIRIRITVTRQFQSQLIFRGSSRSRRPVGRQLQNRIALMRIRIFIKIKIPIQIYIKEQKTVLDSYPHQCDADLLHCLKSIYR